MESNVIIPKNDVQDVIILTNDVQDVSRLNSFVDEACTAKGLDLPTTTQMNLAVEEAVVNVMYYAYPEGTRGDIFVKALADDDSLTFVISDQGVPFDPTSVDDPDTTLEADERALGGLGIYLTRHYMDIVSYERKDGWNILTLKKFFPHQQP